MMIDESPSGETGEARNPPSETLSPMTPPPEVRTDPERGTGELGGENMDPLDPLPRGDANETP